MRALLSLILLICIANSFGQKIAIMIHGAGGGGWEYMFWKPVFEKAGWKVIAKDLLPSKEGLAATSFSNYVDQAKSWIPAKREKLVLIGASMGGALVLELAKEVKPDRVILINSVLPKGYGWNVSTGKIPPIIEWENGPLQDTIIAMPDSDRKTQIYAWKHWRNESGKVMQTLRDGLEYRKPSCPVLFIVSGKDTDVPAHESIRWAESWESDIQYYAGLSHVGPLMSRRGDHVASLALGWIEKS